MPPAEWEHSSVVAFLQCFSQRRYRYAHSNQFVVWRIPVFYESDEIEVEYREIHFEVFVNLRFGHLRVSVEVSECLVDHVEHFSSHLFFAKNLATFYLSYVKVVSLHHHLCDFSVFVGHRSLFWHNKFELHVVVVFLPTAHLFHVFWIVGIVVNSRHRTQLVESFNEHTLWIHVRIAEWSYHFGHTFGAPPLFNGLK